MNDNSESALKASNKAVQFAHEHQSKYISEIEAQNSDLKNRQRIKLYIFMYIILFVISYVLWL